ncbi:glycosyltransferase family 4 protein [Oenococcus oeni]|uniref:glycosyltransferase family 4 protein n=1 Tax=Oenococcus oeni TaxID=1247 RepID=UPI0010AF604A|nr:glycosyltransferase family 4 protein [Oenococcus oeni]SYW14872.1 putative Glycosyltransferase, family 1 (GT1) [Oenococcus oeni]
MKVNFIMPVFYKRKPIGGFKIIYSYANGLVQTGNEVTITYMSDAFPKHWDFFSIVKELIRFIYHKIIKYVPRKINWFPLDKRIRLVVEKTPIKKTFVNADIVIATASSTAPVVLALPRSKGSKFYFLQHDESTFPVDHNTVKTWGMGLHLIAVANWIKQRVQNHYPDLEVDIVPNFVDFNTFQLTQPIEQRKRVISMLIHTDPVKGTKYGIEALRWIQTKYPDVRIILFGTCPKPQVPGLQFQYYENATPNVLCKIYNDSMIYIMPSILEGWGLTATEAMQCGTALVTTENGGVNDFTKKNFSAIRVPTKSSFDLEMAVERLLCDDVLRQKIARNGHQDIQIYTFERSLQMFKKSLKDRSGQ